MFDNHIQNICVAQMEREEEKKERDKGEKERRKEKVVRR